MENHYVTRVKGIRRQGGTVQVYANLPLPLAVALDLEPGEKVTWKVLDGTHLRVLRLPTQLFSLKPSSGKIRARFRAK
jgi:hypothetical protein